MKITLDGVPVMNGAGTVNPEVLTASKAVVSLDREKSAPRQRVTRTLNVSVIGTGYVGLVTGAILADQGSNVICVDNNPAKLEVIERGESPIYEPGLDKIIQSALRAGRLKTSGDLAAAVENSDVVYIAVGTPPSADGTPDLTAVIQVVNQIAPAIKKHITLVTKSTVPVGTGDLIENTLQDLGVDPNLVDVVSNPEFLREGSAVYDTFNPDRIVVGVNRPGAEIKLLELYGRYGCPILVTNRTSAELIKYASNSFLAVKISFINAISRICEQSGADVAEVAKGMGLDSRIGKQFLNAGLGWGGSCFPKDVQGLLKCAETTGYDFTMLKSAEDINNDQTSHFMSRLSDQLGTFEGKTIALLGLAFKPNTDDIRDAKALEIIDLLKAGGAKIRAYDPVAMPNMMEVHPDIDYKSGGQETVEGADAAILVTEWEEFKWLDFDLAASTMKGDLLFDGRRAFRREDVEKSGLRYFTIGV
ncbi:MAG: nucleotide sugar dehydrogenase [Fimbriimonadaceae bacterium]|nr:nucleotide sugar dehydrogenase [Fimbriimonadaceae bacterium]